MKIPSMLLFLSLLQTPIFACNSDGTKGIVEENDLFIPVGDKSAGGITKEEFNKVIDEVEAIYKPIVADKNATLQVVRNWDSGTVNAYAQQAGKTWKVSMFGGLARHKTITSDGFALVLCHELGHHLGGAPKKRGWFSKSWATNEGQADYFGTLKCMRRYMQDHDNLEIIESMIVPTEVASACEEQFADDNERAICIRNSMAGLSLGNLFRALKRLRTKLSFLTPDPRRVSRTSHSHPAPQCRLDTYFQGALCNKDFEVDVDNDDDTVGTCSRSRGAKIGIRPLCWYKPSL